MSWSSTTPFQMYYNKRCLPAHEFCCDFSIIDLQSKQKESRIWLLWLTTFEAEVNKKYLIKRYLSDIFLMSLI